MLKPQQQTWKVSHKVSSRGVLFTRKYWFGGTCGFPVGVLILSREVRNLFWVWMNSMKCRERQLFSVNLQAKYSFCLSFSENFLDRSKLQVTIIFLHKKPVYKELALRWQIAKQLSGLNPFLLSNNKNYRLNKSGVSLL